MKRIVSLVMLSGLALVLPVAAQTIPQSIKVQGYLSDQTGGPPVPANGSFNMLFEIFDAPTGGALLATAGPLAITVTNGVYEASIPATASVFSGSPRYLQITVSGELLSPRLVFDSTPFALRSEVAVKAETVAPGSVGAEGLADSSVTSSKIGVPCAEGQILLRSGETWTCATLPAAPQVCPDGSWIPCYTGPPGTYNVGTCRGGTSTCKADRTGFNSCVGSVTPVVEICDSLDNDCDGQVDEGGVCVAPSVTSVAATLVTSNSATLNGSANPNGSATTGWFRYSVTDPGTCNDTFGTRAPSTLGSTLGSGASPVAYSRGISGLLPNTTYYYCAIASNPQGTSFGSMLSFTTPATPPGATTNAVSSITSSSVTLNGSGTPNGQSATGWFRYSTVNPGTCDDTFGTRAPSTGGSSLGSGSTAVPYAQEISGLAPVTTYYYCAIVSNSVGTSFGTVLSFTTRGPPTVTTSAATSVGSSFATLNGSANPNAQFTTGWFRYSAVDPGTCDDSFGTRAPASGGFSLGSGSTPVAYSLGISGLAPATTYYYCAIASNFWGTSFGSMLSFTTTP